MVYVRDQPASDRAFLNALIHSDWPKRLTSQNKTSLGGLGIDVLKEACNGSCPHLVQLEQPREPIFFRNIGRPAVGSGHGWPAELVGMRTHARHRRVIVWRWCLVTNSRSGLNRVRPPDKQGAFCTQDLQASRLGWSFFLKTPI